MLCVVEEQGDEGVLCVVSVCRTKVIKECCVLCVV